MRTKYCPHCASVKIHREEESDGSHFHECEDCQETWEHHDASNPIIGSHDMKTVAVKSNN